MNPNTPNQEAKRKDIKDYLHLYLGGKVEIGATLPGVLLGVEGNAAFVKHFTEGRICMALKQIKPILRPLSDMTEDELSKTFTKEVVDGKFLLTTHYETVRELLKHGFDLFGLIEAGLAIDKTKLKP